MFLSLFLSFDQVKRSSEIQSSENETFDQVKNDNFDQVKFDQLNLCRIISMQVQIYVICSLIKKILSIF
jgi:hypothetical protein